MVEIIPTINVKTIKEIKERVKTIEHIGVKWAQLDVSDGIFSDLVTFNNPEELRELTTSLELEAHLMIYEPEYELDKWIKSGVKRIIFHYEATHKRREIIQIVKGAWLEVGIALKPITPWQFAERFFGDIDLIQILGVKPGLSGQKFCGEEIIHKIKTLKEVCPSKIIEVDGGINDKNAKMIVEAGSDILAVGSYLFNNDDPKSAFEKLKAAIERQDL